MYAVASIVFAAVMAVVFANRRTSHPFPRFGPANQVTTVRAALTSLVVALTGEPPTAAAAMAAITLGLAATVLDGFDGWLARRTGLASALGARFDMEIDALLILALSILAWRHEKAGAWVVLSGLWRYAFVAAGWVWTWMNGPLPRTFRARLVCVIQIAALLIVLVPGIEPPVSTTVAAAGLAALTYSFAVDALWLARHRQDWTS